MTVKRKKIPENGETHPATARQRARLGKKIKNTKNWYTIDALGAFFAIFTILLQYYYNTFIILL